MSVYYGKAIPVQAIRGPYGSRRLRLPGFLNNWHMKVAKLSAQCTGYLYSPGETPWYSFLFEAESTPVPQCGQKD